MFATISIFPRMLDSRTSIDPKDSEKRLIKSYQFYVVLSGNPARVTVTGF